MNKRPTRGVSITGRGSTSPEYPFIYKTLVKNLRKIKEHRQVIIVTHNANIAVLGDAELIVPLKSTSEKTHVIDRGSIDNSKTKAITCAILEGGEKAFVKRKEIYGI